MDTVAVIKRLIVRVEIILGAFILSAAVGMIVANLLGNGGNVPESELTLLTRTLIALVLIGGAMFYDGLRRGRFWG